MTTEHGTKTKRQIAIDTLEGLFGVDYVRMHRERLLETLAEHTGDRGILDLNATESIFERFESIFGGGR